MKLNSLIPELEVSNLQVSLDFYLKTIGFEVLYARPEEKFAMLHLEEAQLMLEQAEFPKGGRFQIAPLEQPLGRGMNLQIKVSNVENIYAQCESKQCRIVIPLEEKWYRRESEELGNKQFVVADPDGYLLRFSRSLGKRELK